jgi:hypothetical protein
MEYSYEVLCEGRVIEDGLVRRQDAVNLEQHIKTLHLIYGRRSGITIRIIIEFTE